MSAALPADPRSDPTEEPNMMLAGVPVRDELVLELARLVDDPDLAQRLETAYGRDVRVLALTIPDRETILVALDDPPPGLEELCGVLLREHTARARGEMA